jgi:hypothetical protein
MKSGSNPYTCNEYRIEMILLGLNNRLNQENLTQEERQKIEEEIVRLESDMGMS